MRIAIIFEYPTLNGGERSMLAALRELRRGKDDLSLAALAPPAGPLAEALRAARIELLPLSLHDDQGRRYSLEECGARLQGALSGRPFDLVHANSLSMSRLLGRIQPGLKRLTAGHLRDIIRLNQRAVDDLNRNRRLAAVSHAARDFHIAQGLNPSRVEVLYNGVDLERFAPRPPSGTLRAELGLPPSAFLMATIGQIGLRKGQDVLAEAASLLRRRKDLHYLIAGERHSSKPESLEFERRLPERFAAAGLAEQLHLLGYREDVPQLLNEVDLLVHPAHQEPLGRVLLEAAASGLPIIATDVGGTREILEDGVSGRLIPAGSPLSLAQAITDLAGDAELRSRFGREARRRMEERFPISAAARGLWDFWRSTLASG